MSNQQKMKLFVAMPYGENTGVLDFMIPKDEMTIDFEYVWKSIIAPAIPSTFEFKRADEVNKPGSIEGIYIDWLYNSDVIVADLTFHNPNVYYEIGIRYALSKGGTVLIAQLGSDFPFDIRNQKVIFYDFRGDNDSFQKKLEAAILQAATRELDSPVHQVLTGIFVKQYKNGDSPEIEINQLKKIIAKQDRKLSELQSARREARLLKRIEENSKNTSALISMYNQICDLPMVSIEVLEQMGKNLVKVGKTEPAIDLLTRALEKAPDDSDILRELGFAYRKKGKNHYDQAEKYFLAALQINDGDPELHGMIGGKLKRQGEYEKAREHYYKAYCLDEESLYAVVTMGAISAVLHHKSDAEKYYEKVLDLSEKQIDSESSDHWTHFCKGEAYVYFGNEVLATQSFGQALEFEPQIEDVRSAAQSLEFLIENGLQRNLSQHILDSILYPEIHGKNLGRLRHEKSISERQSKVQKGSKRKKVFISYSHKDVVWLKRVQTHIKALENEGIVIELWDDTKIKAGMTWEEEIKNALSEAKVALLLITTEFLASDFISKNELPPLLTAAEEDGAIIIPLIVKPSRFARNKSISRFQAINEPDRPLAKLEEAEQDEILVKLTEVIEEYLV